MARAAVGKWPLVRGQLGAARLRATLPRPTIADMASDAVAGERRSLTISMGATGLIGVAAIVLGIVTDARIILFDGVYMLAGIVLVAVSMLASRVAQTRPTPEYPFGMHAATPLAVALQGAALLGTLAYGAIDAVSVIAVGGSDAAALPVLTYGVATATASLLVMGLLRPGARVSSLARAELVSWRVGALMSLVVAAGGGIGLLLTERTDLVRYLDPGLVLVACALALPMALGLTRQGVRELLEAAPPEPLRAQISEAVAAGVAAVSSLSGTHTLGDPVIRSTKLGRRLYVEVDFIVAEHEWTVDEEDDIRRAIVQRLDTLDLEIWATVELTTDPALAAD